MSELLGKIPALVPDDDGEETSTDEGEGSGSSSEMSSCSCESGSGGAAFYCGGGSSEEGAAVVRRRSCIGGAGTLQLPLPRRSRQLRAARPGFVGTPLSPIPGTPNTTAEHSFSVSPTVASRKEAVDRAAERERVAAAPSPCRATKGLGVRTEGAHAPIPDCGAGEGVSWSAGQGWSSTRRRKGNHTTDEALVARARQVSLPLKVRSPGLEVRPALALDPALPAKKRPPFPEFAAAAAALSCLDRSQPVKKRLPRFLAADPPHMPIALLC